MQGPPQRCLSPRWRQILCSGLDLSLAAGEGEEEEAGHSGGQSSPARTQGKKTGLFHQTTEAGVCEGWGSEKAQGRDRHRPPHTGPEHTDHFRDSKRQSKYRVGSFLFETGRVSQDAGHGPPRAEFLLRAGVPASPPTCWDSWGRSFLPVLAGLLQQRLSRITQA